MRSNQRTRFCWRWKHNNDLLDIDVSKNISIQREEVDQTCLRMTRLKRRRNIPAANNEQSVSQNVVVMNSENSDTDFVCSKLFRPVGHSFV